MFRVSGLLFFVETYLRKRGKVIGIVHAWGTTSDHKTALTMPGNVRFIPTHLIIVDVIFSRFISALSTISLNYIINNMTCSCISISLQAIFTGQNAITCLTMNKTHRFRELKELYVDTTRF